MKNGTIPVVRQREKINQEYSDIVIDLGKFKVELNNIDSRTKFIEEESRKLLERTRVLAQEMAERDKEDARLAALEKERQPDLAPQDANEMSQ
jgi:hypothetical protein